MRGAGKGRAGAARGRARRAPAGLLVLAPALALLAATPGASQGVSQDSAELPLVLRLARAQGARADAAPGPGADPLPSPLPLPAGGGAAGRASLEPVAEAAAQRHGVAVGFFKRLIHQESGYNPFAVSHAGALGIAQFMPGTAALVGLDDPFDPVKALAKSAEHLADLQRRLGNLGLAAAAYNAGEGRVRAWLSGRSSLPSETQDYVRAITGRPAADWAPPGARPMPETSFASLRPASAPGLPTLTRFRSPEWQFAVTLTADRNPVSALLDRPAPPAARPAPRPRRAAGAGGLVREKGLAGEKQLCADMGRGCILATVY